MSRHRDWDYEDDDYRSFKKPKKVEKDKLNKHRKAIYEMIDDEEDEEYFTDYREYEFDEE